MPALSSHSAFASHERPPGNLAELWRDQKGWRSRDLATESWHIELPRPLADQIMECAARATNLADAVATWVPHASAAPLCDRVERALEGGVGFCLLHGMALSGDAEIDERAALLYAVLFGRPVSQTRQGDYVARVENTGGDLRSAGIRGHEVSLALPFHCDRADRVLLACMRAARSGGHSRLVSGRALADVLQSEAPALAARLFRPMPQDRRGEAAAGGLPFMMMPVFSEQDGVFVGRYLRYYIQNAQSHPQAPRLTAEDLAALDALDAIGERDGMALEMPFAPGDIQVINNNVVFHGRTAFEDFGEPDRRRLLLRIWLSHASGRKLPDSFRDLYGPTGAGAYRGGIWPRGKRTVAPSPGRLNGD